MTNKLRKSDITKKNILDVAERLFVEKGPEGASMRDITHAANVNLAAVNYHFGSKDELIIAVMKRRLGAINAERLRLLDELELQANGKPIKPSALVNAFFGSLLAHAGDEQHDGGIFLRLLEQTMVNPSSFISAIVAKENALVFERYKQAFFKAMPDVPEEEIIWRFQFMLGATSYAISGIKALLEVTEHNPVNSAKLYDHYDHKLKPRLLSFILGGLRAPLPEFEKLSQV
ncbi:TetR/AcrR family transcriptional regulator [Pelistega europaea]|uniref:TetR/AcrR family transcriptional regulator n=1 Tax=Pelistega europaea TaxID=106147 RepID=A0A7Y4L8Z6_9BURK|nr:TetR/AcrR family transcriptional regulator [Pelistega europaea]NOL49187.1 TetR/AcrR family transcriptional regulator [Pelistega europaea]